jgi:pyruvate carboxylase
LIPIVESFLVSSSILQKALKACEAWATDWKMEFSIKAPFEGVVKKLCVAEAQQLSPGQQLIEIDPVAAAGGASE